MKIEKASRDVPEPNYKPVISNKKKHENKLKSFLNSEQVRFCEDCCPMIFEKRNFEGSDKMYNMLTRCCGNCPVEKFIEWISHS